ncbi:MAG: PSD1 and planctomycete cytochrome C domain-containing protein [Planctomycetaceae bacterium]
MPTLYSLLPHHRGSLMRMTIAITVVVVTALPVLAEDVVFENSVRPILKAHCWHCHGEDADLKGKLDARLVRLLTKGGESGPAVVAGDHASSLLYQRIASGEMPPGEKKVSADELQVIARWIDAGAKTARPEPEQAPEAGSLFSAEDHAHWAFQPITRPPVPTVTPADQVKTPVDAFLLSRLQSQQLAFSPEADRETLLRRAWIDLVGLPPTPEAIDRFLADQSPDAWNKVVEELLASPAYGERWARHWLDVAGYADSEGYTEKDAERAWAWKYRDYVIRSLNADKPFDQFLREQLAGDEMLTPPYENLSAEQADCLTATGFLRMAPDGTADGSVDQKVARNDVIAETLKTVSTSLLGLSVGCAQCHEHRYDPITQSDYYRLRALFEPAYDTDSWRNPNGRLISMWSAETRAAATAVDAELADVSKRRTEELDKIVAETFERELQKLPADQQPLARAARETAADKRTPEQQQLIKEFPFLNVDRGSVYLYLPDRLTGFNKKWDDLTEETKKKRPADDYVMCLTEVPGRIPKTHLFARGDHLQPRQEILPGDLTILATDGFQIAADDETLPTSGRRLSWAKRLTNGQHPLLARVLVNRFWMHHFGQGIVTTPADFGLKGDRPSHPELLDWLASEFMDKGWSLKHLHRLILNSAAWRQSSVRRPEHDAIDPDNRLLARMNVRRLEAEAVRDSILSISGQLNTKPYGKPAPVSPDDVGQIVIAIDTRDSAGRPTGKVEALNGEDLRRSIYVQVRRSMPLGVLEPFDLPRMTPNCERRVASTTASQSLLMMNNPFVVQHGDALSARIRAASSELRQQQALAWRLVFGHQAAESDLNAAAEFVAAGVAAIGADKPDASVRAMNDWCHALLCSSGFLYVE